VEAGKKAAAAVLSIQQKLVSHLHANADRTFNADDLADGIGDPDAAETVFKIATHLAANGRGVKAAGGRGAGTLFQAA
jgi:glucose-6-phosphate isomerase